MKIVPAVLAKNVEDLYGMIRQAELFTDYVQIDIMDGSFVPTKSFPYGELYTLATSLSFELHLMVQNPGSIIACMENPSLKKVIFHQETDGDKSSIINQLKERGILAGLAIKPETEISAFKELADHVDTLLFLTVDPCCYGNPFRPEVLKKVELSRELFPGKSIAVDGGVSLENIGYFYQIGVDYVCVGSRIFLNAADGGFPGTVPAESYFAFVKKVEEVKSREPR